MSSLSAGSPAIVATATATAPTTAPPAAPIPSPPHLARRGGARPRAGCPCQAPAIRYRLRCRMHGGRSTGPRTAQGLANIRAARTVPGDFSAETRAKNRLRIPLLGRPRVAIAADRYQNFLHPAFAARLNGYPPELMAPHR